MTHDEFINLKKGDIVKVTANSRYKNYYGVVSGKEPEGKIVCIMFGNDSIPGQLSFENTRVVYSFCMNVTNIVLKDVAKLKDSCQKVMAKYPGLLLETLLNMDPKEKKSKK